jgi:hypothetical protein
MHSLSPEMTAMLGCVHGAGVTLATQINHNHYPAESTKNHKKGELLLPFFFCDPNR